MTADHPSVQQLVAERFPGVILESEIQGWVFLGEFEEGAASYGRIEAPTAQDDRWLGVCYFQLFRDLDALEALYRAINRGEEGARVNAAHVLRFVERAADVDEELGKVNVEELRPYDRVLFHRVLSLQEENNGDLRNALKAAEDAWRIVQGIPEFGLLAPSILAQLAILHGRIGRSQRALWFLERGLQFAGDIEQAKVRLKRSAVLINLGRYKEAQAELETLEFPEAGPIQVERRMRQGQLNWAIGKIDRAIDDLTEASAMAVEMQTTYEEFISRLALVSILAARAEFGAAREHIARAQALIADKSDRLVYRFREVILLHRMGTYSVSHALDELEALVLEFGDMGLMQEECAVRLHIADILLSLELPEYSKQLDRVQALTVSLQNQAFLAPEWALLPSLMRSAQKSHPRIAGRPNVALQVFTLAQERLAVGKTAINIPLRRGTEVLAYFLEHKTVTLKRLLADIFPDDKPRSAKSYFHQFRHQLRESVDGLEIEYDGESKMYRLKSEIDIVWDVAELRAGRIIGETGLFLPSSGNDWALAVDQALDPYREAVGALDTI